MFVTVLVDVNTGKDKIDIKNIFRAHDIYNSLEASYNMEYTFLGFFDIF